MQNRNFWIDKSAIGLSGLCLMHCLLTTLAIIALSAGSAGFFSHEVHQVGLGIAIPLALIGLGRGFVRHRRWPVLVIGGLGILFMALAVMRHHGHGEMGFTVLGGVLVAVAHGLNIRWMHA